MALDDTIADLHKAHQEGQSKYTYFLLTAAGAGIGLAVQKTEGLFLTWWLLPVGLAAACWVASFYHGCKNVEWVQTALSANYNLLNLRQGTHPQQPGEQELHQAAIPGVKKAIQYNINQAQHYGIWQFRLLVIGAIFFISWRIAEMVRISCL